MYEISNRKSYILTSVCLLFLVYDLWVLKTHQPVGYVINFYELLPLHFYLILFFAYFSSGVLLFGSRTKLAAFILIFLNIVVLLIPYMLGYFSIGRADDLSYLGYYVKILKNGAISLSDIYPASALLGVSFSELAGFKATIVAFLLPIHFSFLFILGMLAFFKKFASNNVVFSVAVLSSFIYYFSHFHNSIAPHYFFFSMLPLYLLVIHSYTTKKNPAMAISLMGLFLVVPLGHPFIFTFLVYGLGVLFFFKVLSESRYFKSGFLGSSFASISLERLQSGILVLFTAFFGWFLFNKKYLHMFSQIYVSFHNRLTEPVLMETASKLSRIEMGPFEFFRFFNLYYARYYLPFLFILLASFFLYMQRAKFEAAFSRRYFNFLLIYMGLFILEVFFFFNTMVSHQPDRLTNLNFVIFAQIPLFAYALYILFLKNSSKKGVVAVLLLLNLLWGLSFFSCFHSPYIYHTSDAITYNEVEGMGWFYERKVDYPVSMLFEQVNRFHDVFGESTNNPIDDSVRDPIFHIPDHLGYDEWNVSQNRSFAQINLQRSRNIYVVLTPVEEFLYQLVPGYRNVGRYTAEDFRRFRSDPTVSKVYESLNIEFYKCGVGSSVSESLPASKSMNAGLGENNTTSGDNLPVENSMVLVNTSFAGNA